MSDALSDIAQDEYINRAWRTLRVKEIDFLYSSMDDRKREEGCRELMNEWYEYMKMRGGYNTSPSEGVAKWRILQYAKLLEGKIGIDEVRKEFDEKDDGVRNFYFAVGGHGKLMPGDVENDLLRPALERKFGRVPHSFKAVIGKDGRIDFKKSSCGNCVYLHRCTIAERCNCYNKKEFDKGKKELEKNSMEIKECLGKYFPKDSKG